MNTPESEQTFALAARQVFVGDEMLNDRVVVVTGGAISAVQPREELAGEVTVTDLGDVCLAPGFIDLQVNGGGGVLFNNDPSANAVVQMLRGHARQGTTALMPTLLSDTREVLRAGVDAVLGLRDSGNAGVLGIHIEGPFFATTKRGTHRADSIRPLEQEDIDWLCGLPPLPVILTLAPECTRPGQIRQLVEAGIRVCAGHTEASYERMQQAFDEGLEGCTHLFNAMGRLTAREPGVVGAVLDSDGTWAGIIADGHHVHPASIRLAQRSKPAGKLLLVSDAMATVGSPDQHFELYGKRIEASEGRLVNAEGKLAGSAIGLIDAVRFCQREVGLPLQECLRMASLYPAERLAIANERGRLAPGYRADLVSFDVDLRVCSTWVGGRLAYSRR